MSHNQALATPVEFINDVTFTPREIDILACLLSGKSAKRIASLLSVTSKTVEAHIYNIMNKLDCHSKENIISFVEKSPQLLLIKRHYFYLLMQVDFTQKMGHITHLANKPPILHIVLEEPITDELPLFIQEVITFLSLAGIRIVLEKDKHIICPDQPNTKGTFNNDALLYIPSLENKMQNNTLQLRKNVTNLISAGDNNSSSIICLLPKALCENFLTNEENEKKITYLNEEDHSCFLALNILKVLLPTIDSLATRFQKHWSSILSDTTTLVLPEEQPEESTSPPVKRFLEWVYKHKLVSIGFLVCLPIICGLIWYGFLQKPPLTSDFLLPAEANTLNRPLLIKKIEEKTNNRDNLKTVVIVGIGGAGKTTLAHQYAKTQRLPLLWEINAETKATLVESFEQLAYAASRTAQESHELEIIKRVEDAKERINKLMVFVKKKLRNLKRWGLIFDNVENFADIQDFFPNDSHTWGKGLVLITTRNRHIQNSPYVNANHVLDVNPLEEKEKYELFTSIVMGNKKCKLDDKQKKEIETFLKFIPPFPLDVSVAGYYIKNTHISPQDYLKRLQSYDCELEKSQNTFLKETSGYKKTRYLIITSTIKQLIETRPEFAELLLLVSALDEQNIPKKLLEIYQNKEIVDSFIRHMGRHSLLSVESSNKQTLTLSIHRSTQKITLQYLAQTLDKEKKQQYVNNIARKVSLNFCVHHQLKNFDEKFP